MKNKQFCNKILSSVMGDNCFKLFGCLENPEQTNLAVPEVKSKMPTRKSYQCRIGPVKSRMLMKIRFFDEVIFEDFTSF